MRTALKEILVRELGDVICGEVENAEQVLVQAETPNWDLVILDICMPDRSGLEVLGNLVRLKPQPHVLVLSMHSADQYAKRVLNAGASGYLVKGSAEELLKAIRNVLARGRYVSATLAEKLGLRLGENSDHAADEALSGPEFKISE